MKTRRIIAITLLSIAIVLVGALAAWRIFSFEEHARKALIDYLRPRVTPSLKAEHLQVTPGRLTLKKVSLSLSPQTEFRVDAVRIRLSILKFLFGGFRVPGAMDEVEFIGPRLNLSTAPMDTVPTWEYRPFPLKPLSQLGFIRRMSVEGGGISIGRPERMLADSIAGYVDLSSLEDVGISLIGRLPGLPSARAEVEGAADLTEGSFLLSFRVMIEDIAAWQVQDAMPDVEVTGGQLRLNIDLRGADDLRLTGKAAIGDLSANYRGLLQVSGGELAGELFGSAALLEGSLFLNRLQLPVKVEISDIPASVWSVDVEAPALDLARFDGQRLGIPNLTGDVTARVHLEGKKSEWWGWLEASSDSVLIDTITLRSPEMALSAESGIFRLDRFTASLFGGELTMDGTGDLKGGETALDYRFDRSWTGDESAGWCRISEPRLSVMGQLTRSDGGWRADGTGVMFGPDDTVLLDGRIFTSEGKLYVVVTSPNREGRMDLAFFRVRESLKYNLNARDPHRLLEGFLSEGLIPEFLWDYAVRLSLDGDPANAAFLLDWRSQSALRSGSFTGMARSLPEGSWKWNADLALNLPGSELLTGEIAAVYNRDWIRLDRAVLESHDGRQLLEGKGGYVLKDGRFVDFSVTTDSLSVEQLLQYILPEASLDFRSFLNVRVEAVDDAIVWDGRVRVIYPDSVRFVGEFSGRYEADRLSIDRASLTDEADYRELLSLAGTVDFASRELDSLVLRAVDIPVERLFHLVWPRKSEPFGGRVNARLELSGDFDHPCITADAHLTAGLLSGNPGYWMNFRCVTEDSLYQLESFDLGQDVTGLLRASGAMNRYSRAYNLQVDGTDVQLQSLVQAVTGSAGPLTGRSNIAVTLEGGDRPQRAAVDLTVSPGSLGPLSFDEMTASLILTGLGKGEPVIRIDSAAFDFGDAGARVTGQVPLSGDAPVDLSGSAEGRLAGLLPRIDGFFSRPGGSGELSFRIGGTAIAPRIHSGRFELHDAAFRVAAVVGRIDRLNAQIELDSLGRISIRRLEGLADGEPFSFSNRFPLDERAGVSALPAGSEGDGDEPIILGDYNLGIVQLATGSGGFWAVIPSLMEKDWGGYFCFSGPGGEGPFEFRGPAWRPYAAGEIRLRNAAFTYPFLKAGKAPSSFVRWLLDLLQRMQWDVRFIPERSCRYVRELSALGEIPLLDVEFKLYLDLLIEDNPDGLLFTGSVADTLRVRGELTSTHGSVEYLDLSFDIDHLGARFTPADSQPLFYGSARTQVEDTLGISREVRLVIRSSSDDQAVEVGDLSNERPMGGRWGEFSVVFEDDQGHSQEQILAMLGYSPEHLPDRLTDLGVNLVGEVTPLRRWTRFIERRAERWLGVDRIDIEPVVARKLIERQLIPFENAESGTRSNYSYLTTLDQSRVTVGKYLTPDLYLSYTGSLFTEDVYNVTRLGVEHYWDVRIRMSGVAPSLTLNYRYRYDSLALDHDSSLFLRYSLLFGW